MTSKRQVTIPKDLADRFGIEPGDEIQWIPSGDEIRVVPPGRTVDEALNLEERLRLFDEATSRRDARAASPACEDASERGWTRDELYDRGRAS